jgi:hypothetical protein
MGHYTDSHGIKGFYPDDDADTMWISRATPLSEIIQKIEEKWPGATLDQIWIDADYVQTSHIGYDLYDPTDYDTYLVVRRMKN